jgi:hypothetical protein
LKTCTSQSKLFLVANFFWRENEIRINLISASSSLLFLHESFVGLSKCDDNNSFHLLNHSHSFSHCEPRCRRRAYIAPLPQVALIKHISSRAFPGRPSQIAEIFISLRAIKNFMAGIPERSGLIFKFNFQSFKFSTG